jgi:hypothetical protein
MMPCLTFGSAVVAFCVYRGVAQRIVKYCLSVDRRRRDGARHGMTIEETCLLHRGIRPVQGAMCVMDQSHRACDPRQMVTSVL